MTLAIHNPNQVPDPADGPMPLSEFDDRQSYVVHSRVNPTDLLVRQHFLRQDPKYLFRLATTFGELITFDADTTDDEVTIRATEVIETAPTLPETAPEYQIDYLVNNHVGTTLVVTDRAWYREDLQQRYSSLPPEEVRKMFLGSLGITESHSDYEEL